MKIDSLFLQKHVYTQDSADNSLLTVLNDLKIRAKLHFDKHVYIYIYIYLYCNII